MSRKVSIRASITFKISRNSGFVMGDLKKIFTYEFFSIFCPSANDLPIFFLFLISVCYAQVFREHLSSAMCNFFAAMSLTPPVAQAQNLYTLCTCNIWDTL